MKKFKLFLFLVVISKIVFPQSKDDLKKEKKKIENEIKITNGLLEKTKKNKLKSLNYFVSGPPRYYEFVFNLEEGDLRKKKEKLTYYKFISNQK